MGGILGQDVLDDSWRVTVQGRTVTADAPAVGLGVTDTDATIGRSFVTVSQASPVPSPSVSA